MTKHPHDRGYGFMGRVDADYLITIPSPSIFALLAVHSVAFSVHYFSFPVL